MPAFLFPSSSLVGLLWLLMALLLSSQAAGTPVNRTVTSTRSLSSVGNGPRETHTGVQRTLTVTRHTTMHTKSRSRVRTSPVTRTSTQSLVEIVRLSERVWDGAQRACEFIASTAKFVRSPLPRECPATLLYPAWLPRCAVSPVVAANATVDNDLRPLLSVLQTDPSLSAFSNDTGIADVVHPFLLLVELVGNGSSCNASSCGTRHEVLFAQAVLVRFSAAAENATMWSHASRTEPHCFGPTSRTPTATRIGMESRSASETPSIRATTGVGGRTSTPTRRTASRTPTSNRRTSTTTQTLAAHRSVTGTLPMTSAAPSTTVFPSDSPSTTRASSPFTFSPPTVSFGPDVIVQFELLVTAINDTAERVDVARWTVQFGAFIGSTNFSYYVTEDTAPGVDGSTVATMTIAVVFQGSSRSTMQDRLASLPLSVATAAARITHIRWAPLGTLAPGSAPEDQEERSSLLWVYGVGAVAVVIVIGAAAWRAHTSKTGDGKAGDTAPGSDAPIADPSALLLHMPEYMAAVEEQRRLELEHLARGLGQFHPTESIPRHNSRRAERHHRAAPHEAISPDVTSYPLNGDEGGPPMPAPPSRRLPPGAQPGGPPSVPSGLPRFTSTNDYLGMTATPLDRSRTAHVEPAQRPDHRGLQLDPFL